ncbi:MAG TPA: ankyrin repeat domain-containing protein [Opitutales bacterium]|nr:ankyrin repeat domain-containing protein [Opitutales bacterium]
MKLQSLLNVLGILCCGFVCDGWAMWGSSGGSSAGIPIVIVSHGQPALASSAPSATAAGRSRSDGGRAGHAHRLQRLTGSADGLSLLHRQMEGSEDVQRPWIDQLITLIALGDERRVIRLIEDFPHNDVNDIGHYGLRPLFVAAQQGQTGIMQVLIQVGAVVDMVHAETAQTALHAAARVGQLPAVRFLMTEGANVLAVDADGRTPLHAAAIGGHVATVDCLLARPTVGADPESLRALRFAAEQGHVEVVRLLLARLTHDISQVGIAIRVADARLRVAETVRDTMLEAQLRATLELLRAQIRPVATTTTTTTTTTPRNSTSAGDDCDNVFELDA